MNIYMVLSYFVPCNFYRPCVKTFDDSERASSAAQGSQTITRRTSRHVWSRAPYHWALGDWHHADTKDGASLPRRTARKIPSSEEFSEDSQEIICHLPVFDTRIWHWQMSHFIPLSGSFSEMLETIVLKLVRGWPVRCNTEAAVCTANTAEAR